MKVHYQKIGDKWFVFNRRRDGDPIAHGATVHEAASRLRALYLVHGDRIYAEAV
jgi:hypothetical protein